MRALVALAMPGGPSFVDQLEAAWGRGDAVLPVDPRLPAPAARALLARLGASAVVDAHGTAHALDGGWPVADGDALVVATSGSTGQPKGVVHTHASVAAAAAGTSAALQVDPATDRWLCCLPVAHVAGLNLVTRARWAGVPLVVLPGFDATAVDDEARRGATLTSVVPTVLDRFDAARFRRILVGGAAPPGALPPNATATYGLTETGGGLVYDGHPIDGAEVRLRHGEVLVRGPMLARAYRGSPELPADRALGDADGWFATGDLGAWADDGTLTVLGRSDDLIVTGGVNVWPAPIEAVLSTHPAVADVAVVGRPDPRWGHRVVAVVVPAERAAPPTLEELRAHVKRSLHPACAPRALELVAALPRTELGKLRRPDLV
jgi:O-succinylbenzoic acid--CoA ligase